jgi:hypothetical protein
VAIVSGCAMDESFPTTRLRIALFAGAALWLPLALAATDHARFGERVALQADTLLVGAPEQDGSGRVYVLAYDASGMRLQQRIDPDVPCAGCGFGSSVAIDGMRMAVGEPGSGSVFVYRYEQGIWLREARLRDAQNPALGAAVAISGESVVAASADGRPATVFVRDALEPEHPWLMQARLLPDGEHAHFGTALAIDGDLVAVGDPEPNVGGGGRGTIHVFERDADRWSDATLLARGDVAGNGFGRAFALLGDTLVAGVPGAQRAHVFTQDGTRWLRSATLLPARTGDSQFGASVALSTSVSSEQLLAVVGAPLAANATRRETGLAQIHRGRGDSWSAGRVLLPTQEREAHAGWDVAATGTLAAIGMPDLDLDGVDRGGVAVYTTEGDEGSLPVTVDADAGISDDAPVIDEVAPLVFDEGASATLRLRLDDPDTALDALAVAVQSTDPDVLDDTEILVRDALGGRRVDLAPDADAHGEFALVVLAGDGRSVATRRVPVQIRAVNDTPTFGLAANPVFGPRPGTAPRMLSDFVRDFDPGPREAGQVLVSGLLLETADPAGVVNDAALIPSVDGTTAHLALSLSGRAGSANFDLRIRDSGGIDNGGEDLSAVRRFTVTVLADPAALFFDGFE